MVPMESARPLQDQVHRSQVGHHKVDIDVETLLKHLGPDDDEAAWASERTPVRPRRTEQLAKSPFAGHSRDSQKTTVYQHHALGTQDGDQARVAVLRSGHRVVHHGDTGTVLDCPAYLVAPFRCQAHGEVAFASRVGGNIDHAHVVHGDGQPGVGRGLGDLDART